MISRSMSGNVQQQLVRENRHRSMDITSHDNQKGSPRNFTKAFSSKIQIFTLTSIMQYMAQRLAKMIYIYLYKGCVLLGYTLGYFVECSTSNYHICQKRQTFLWGQISMYKQYPTTEKVHFSGLLCSILCFKYSYLVRTRQQQLA